MACLEKFLDLQSKKCFYKERQMYKIISTKYNEYLLKMGYVGYLYIHNREEAMVLRDTLTWDSDIQVNQQAMLQLHLKPGGSFLGLISSSKQG
jgi:hypothetical protein